ncbi:MAG: MgtC/SapB family protein [Alkalispirochaeta sp.]|jgi:putative Mg2+ transporter-C (MgtC) family protein
MLPIGEIIFRLVLAAVLGSIVGLERERLDWAAGLRTHMLVSLGASLFMIVSSYGFMDILGYPDVDLDPSRVAAGVVSGIGFLGAGTIMFRRDAILGLTTAASLWVVAAVGLAVGGGLYIGAAATTLLVIVILAWMKPIEKRLFQKRRSRSLKLIIDQNASLTDVEGAIESAHVLLKHIVVKNSDTPGQHLLEIVLTQARNKHLIPLVESLRAMPGVCEVTYTSS